MLNYILLKSLFENLTLKSKIRLLKTCHLTYDIFQITHLYYADIKILRQLNDTILKLKIFQHISELDASYNREFKNLSFLKNLKKLRAVGNCGITQDCINGLNLVELIASYNCGIINVSFMTNLKKLNANGNYCGIDQN